MREKGLLELGLRLVPQPVGEYVEENAYHRISANGVSFEMRHACADDFGPDNEIEWEQDCEGDELWEQFARWAGRKGDSTVAHDFIPMSSHIAARRSLVLQETEARDKEPSRDRAYVFGVGDCFLMIWPWLPENTILSCESWHEADPAKIPEIAGQMARMSGILCLPELQEFFNPAASEPAKPGIRYKNDGLFYRFPLVFMRLRPYFLTHMIKKKKILSPLCFASDSKKRP